MQSTIFNIQKKKKKTKKKEGDFMLYQSIKSGLAKATRSHIETAYNVGHPVSVLAATGIKGALISASHFGGHALDLALPVSGGVTGVVCLAELCCIWY